VDATINPSSLKGIVRAPASKSSMQRACAAAIIRKGKTIIHNPGHSNDDKAALGIIRDLGANLESINHEWMILSPGIYPGEQKRIYPGEQKGIYPGEQKGIPGEQERIYPRENEGIHSRHEINCGESGLSIRMFTPVIAIGEKEVVINGTGSLLSRPMDFFDTILPQLGVKIRSKKGMLPLQVRGPLTPADIEIDGSLSSQFLTGLLMAYAGAGAAGVSIKVKNLQSKPYVDLTLQVMKHFGLNTPENRNYEEFVFPASPAPGKKEDTVHYTVEGDWSGGAFLLVAGAIAGPVTVTGLDLSSTQADKAIVDALMAANAGIAIEAKGIKMHPGEMKAFEFDATDCPDLFPPLVALASYCKGETILKGVNRLVFKESNRGLSLWEEFGKMGVDIRVKNDLMMISGGAPLKAATVHSHLDHRIAMACTVAALGSTGKTILEKPGAVKKSYPDFFNDLKSLGADVSLPPSFKIK
jgi:3-phosphoshikimate 1-carboxyvinyltransferase